MSVLDRINKPSDIKELSMEELKLLAQDIREYLLEKVSKTGGHIAPSLGVVELTIALHYVYDSPGDKFVWDVGHQAYPHKILTGRKNRFHTLRQYNGLSGFPKRCESEHDVFDVGHSSTSISAAEGIHEALAAQHKHNMVVAIIGDGALTGGLAYEGLNNISGLKKDYPKKLTVVLNDNSMSIAKNVGGMPRYLHRIITGKLYNQMKEQAEKLLSFVPHVGKSLVKLSRKMEEYLKGMISPGILFEEFGFRYFGPINGHSLEDLINTLKALKDFKDGPFLLHIVTQKGKGFIPAEKDPTKFHGLGPFDKDTGEVRKSVGKSGASYTKVFGETITRLGEEDKRIVTISAAMPTGTGLDIFQDKFPNRFYDVGIAEGHAVTFAAGLATQGMLPVVAIYSSFLQRAYDQVLHDVALQQLPVMFCLDRAGLVGEDGPTHHGNFDISYLRSIPNLLVLAPKNRGEMEAMVEFCIDYLKEKKGPVAMRYPRGNIYEYHESELTPIEFGKGEILRTGNDVAIMTLGRQVKVASDAIAATQKSVGLYNLRFAKPLDEELLEHAFKNYKHLIIVEENTVMGGIYEGICRLYMQKFQQQYPDLRISNISIPDAFIPQGAVPTLLEITGLSFDKIAEKINEVSK